MLTFGTVDVLGRGHDGGVKVIDWKTGQMRDHQPQAAAYGLMAMDAAGENSVEVVFAYLDQRGLVRHEFTRSSAESVVMGILGRVKDGTEAPTPNPYCGFCSVKPTCTAWRSMAVSALVAVDEELAELFAGGLERIKTDPEGSGKFYTRAKMFISLVEDAKFPEVIKEHLEAGRIVPGFRLQRKKGKSTIDPATWLERIAPLAGPEAAAMVNVSVPKVMKWWNERRKGQVLPVEVVEAPATTSVVATTGGD